MHKLIVVIVLLLGGCYSPSYYVIRDSYNTYAPTYTYSPTQNYPKTYQTQTRYQPNSYQPAPNRCMSNNQQRRKQCSFTVGGVEYYIWR
jgi:hypothetical protein